MDIYPEKDVGAERHLKGIVGNEEASDVHGLAIPHVVGTPHLDDIDVGGAEQHGGDGAVHEEPAVHAPIPLLPDLVVEGRVLAVLGRHHVHLDVQRWRTTDSAAIMQVLKLRDSASGILDFSTIAEKQESYKSSSCSKAIKRR